MVGVLCGVLAIGAGAWAFHAKSNRSPAPVASHGTYVAMGDSVAAGVGLESYSDASACDRTQQSYPHGVASRLGFDLTSLACSGAATGPGILASQPVNDLDVTPQLEALYALAQPKVITLTIGANDLGWTELLARCYSSVCGTAADVAQVDARLAAMKLNLGKILGSLQQHYGASGPVVVVTGYYQIYPANFTACADATGVDVAEAQMIRSQQTKLNEALGAVAAQENARFAPVDFAGHELCSAEPWIQGINAAAPFHPTDAGQEAYVAAVTRAAQEAGL